MVRSVPGRSTAAVDKPASKADQIIGCLRDTRGRAEGMTVGAQQQPAVRAALDAEVGGRLAEARMACLPPVEFSS